MIKGNRREQVRQAGNAVTPPAARDLVAAIVDALELAYGPGIRVDAADGGVWVLGRAS